MTPNFNECDGVMLGDKYRLEKYLASGTFGAVYRATHLAYGSTLRSVAIKIAKRPMQPSEARHAFHDALTMARVVDEAGRTEMARRFVAVYDAGFCPEGCRFPGHPYMVMEYVTGTTLADCIRRGPFPLQRALAVFEALLECVAFMHTPGSGGRSGGVVIHRDIKPENVLVSHPETGKPEIKLTDFGLAIDLKNVLAWTESGGTLAYLAPESFTEGINSTKSDVYSLALVFYEMLAGRNPFSEIGRHLDGETIEKQEELSRLHQSARTLELFPVLQTSSEMCLRPEIGRVIRAALTPDHQARPFSDAAAFLAAFRSALGGSGNVRLETPTELARRLTNLALSNFEAGYFNESDALLEEVMLMHSDDGPIPDHLLVGRAFLFKVERLLESGRYDEAGKVAQEAFRRRQCRSSCLAMAAFCRKQNVGLARHYEQLAKDFPRDE